MEQYYRTIAENGLKSNNKQKMIQPQIWEEQYEIASTQYKQNKTPDQDLIEEENTIYEIDIECLECLKKRKSQNIRC